MYYIVLQDNSKGKKIHLTAKDKSPVLTCQLRPGEPLATAVPRAALLQLEPLLALEQVEFSILPNGHRYVVDSDTQKSMVTLTWKQKLSTSSSRKELKQYSIEYFCIHVHE